MHFKKESLRKQRKIKIRNFNSTTLMISSNIAQARKNVENFTGRLKRKYKHKQNLVSLKRKMNNYYIN